MQSPPSISAFYPPNRKGFTLVEMLIAVAIIAILAIMITPAISNGIASAKAAKCVNNLRQLGLMSNTYSADFDNQFPWAWGSVSSWMESMVAHVEFGGDLAKARDAIAREKVPSRCPVRTLSNAEYDAINKKTYWYSYGINYVNLGGGGALVPPISRLMVKNPSKCVFLADGKPETGWGYLVNPGWGDAQPSDRHQGRSNVLWADGHVTSEDQAWLVAPANRYLWQPNP